MQSGTAPPSGSGLTDPQKDMMRAFVGVLQKAALTQALQLARHRGVSVAETADLVDAMKFQVLRGAGAELGEAQAHVLAGRSPSANGPAVQAAAARLKEERKGNEDGGDVVDPAQVLVWEPEEEGSEATRCACSPCQATKQAVEAFDAWEPQEPLQRHAKAFVRDFEDRALAMAVAASASDEPDEE